MIYWQDLAVIALGFVVGFLVGFIYGLREGRKDFWKYPSSAFRVKSK